MASGVGMGTGWAGGKDRGFVSVTLLVEIEINSFVEGMSCSIKPDLNLEESGERSVKNNTTSAIPHVVKFTRLTGSNKLLIHSKAVELPSLMDT